MKVYIIHFLTFIITRNFKLFLFLIRIRNNFRTSQSLKARVSVINTYDLGGGAAKIARELVQSLLDTLEIRLYVKTKKSKDVLINEIQPKRYSFLEEVLRREGVKKGWIEFTGFHAISLVKDPFFINSSIVHLHNLHGEFFSPILFKSLFKGKKVIWTLHDESFITGHCSCTLGCDRWQKGCGSCPDLTIYPPVQYDNTKEVLHYKKKWITELQPIVVCPSSWLANRVRLAYPYLNRIEVIPNGVDRQVFCPKDKYKIRELLNLPIEKKIVLFVAEFATQNPFKGGAILREIISDSTFSDLIFVTVGGKHESSFFNHICYPYIVEEKELANLYAACDVLLYPTQADNLPLVVLESMACGTPVIASKLGGIPELIDSDIDGLLVENYLSSVEFKSSLRSFFEFSNAKRELLSINSSLKISTNFSLERMNQEYLNLYKQFLNE